MENVFIHPTAIVETKDIGEGTKIWANSHLCKGAKVGKNCMIGEGVHIGTNVVIGNDVKIQNHCLVYEGVTIEDEAFLGPAVVTTNDIRPRSVGDWKDRFRTTLIKKGASIGANSTILCGIVIGENALVGAGSTVVHSIPDGVTVVGNPAHPILSQEDYHG
jgi:UDP-2-acetamido-3-amino-2,3-dideoxy-glucuronate N-acetyltransferase